MTRIVTNLDERRRKVLEEVFRLFLDPSPTVFDLDLCEHIEATVGLRDDYYWVYFWGHQPSVAGGGGRAAVGQSDPTGEIVVHGVPEDGGSVTTGKTELRAGTRAVVEALRVNTNDMKSMSDRLRGLLGGGKPELGLKPQGPFPYSLKPGQLEEAEDAQRRRRIRAETYGEG